MKSRAKPAGDIRLRRSSRPSHGFRQPTRPSRCRPCLCGGADGRALTPDQACELAWSRTALALALARLEAEMTARGLAREFALLAPMLSGADAGDYAAPARDLGITAGYVATKVVRLRRRLRELFEAEVASTLGPDCDVAAEVRELLLALTTR
ncbi:MAG: hypothetical protein KIT22_09120 [Verrucomicrobiae bacterium]|nr:hypothetical protein [Verrucomicrobiae bacterium]